jgi:hypothetical protein
MPIFLLVIAGFLLWLYIGNQGGKPASGGSFEDQMSGSDALTKFVEGWANAEGYNVSGSLAQRNNNPVNLKGDWPGATGHDQYGFAIFDSPESGFAAAQTYVNQNAASHPLWTLQNFFAKVLGNLQGQPVDNDQGNSDQEAANVASYLGVSPDTTVSDYLGVQS